MDKVGTILIVLLVLDIAALIGTFLYSTILSGITGTFFYFLAIILFSLLLLLTFVYGLKSHEWMPLFTTGIIILTFTQIWIAWYTISPKVFGPATPCPNQLFVTNSTQFQATLGDYGQIPTWVKFMFKGQNLILDDKVIVDNYYNGIVSYALLIPASTGAQQTSTIYNLKVANTAIGSANFTLKWVPIIDIADEVDLWIESIQEGNISPQFSCEYTKSSETTYKLVSS